MDVERLLMPRECDAVMVGLVSGRRPQVFLKAGRSEKRMRFTLAHELGHYFISWHLGTIICHSDPLEVGERLGRWEEEAEANRFASEFLMPTEWLRSVFDSESSVAAAIERVQEANVSAAAACYALSDFLPAGHALAIEDSGVVRYLFKSAGTQANLPHRGEELHRDSIERTASDFAQIQFGGQVIDWWYFEPRSDLIESSDARTPTEIIRAILNDVILDEAEREELFRSIQAIAGYAKNVASDPTDPQTLHAVLWQRFSERPNLEDVMNHSDFALFLSRRAEQLARPKGAK